MGLLKHILSEAIAGNLENSINTALNNHNAVKIRYISQTKSDIASGERTIYPTAYGLSTANNPVIRAYQVDGDSSSKHKMSKFKPGWSLFRLDGIKSWETTDEKFTTRDLPGLKLEPDLQMSTEFNTAFGGAELKKTIDDTPITKDEIDNPKNLEKTSNYTPSQKSTVQHPETIDNFVQKTDTPSGINPSLPTAPKNEPIVKNQFDTVDTVPNDETEKEALPAEPIMRDNIPADELEQEVDQMTDEKAEETEDAMKQEDLNEAYNLIHRMNNLYKKR